jgi:hypothetical protein
MFDSTGVTLAQFVAGTTQWLETGLTPNTLYTRKLQSWNVSGTSLSNSATRYTLAAVPGLFQVTQVTSATVTISWTANNNPGYTRYVITRSTDGFVGSFIPVKTIVDNFVSTSYMDTGLNTYTNNYLYSLVAFNEESVDVFYPATVGTVDITPPGKVTQATVIAAGYGQTIELGWVNPTDEDFTGTVIRYSMTKYPQTLNDGILAVTLNKSVTSYIHRNLSDNVTYYYGIFTFDKLTNYSSATTVSCYPFTTVTVPGKFSVKVVDIASAPVSGATVELLQGTSVMITAQTDVNGAYEREWSDGYYDIRVTKTGYLTQVKQNVRIVRAQVSLTEFVLNTVNQKPELTLWLSSYTPQVPVSGSDVNVVIGIANIGTGSINQPLL